MRPPTRGGPASLACGASSTWRSRPRSLRWRPRLRLLLVLAGLPKPEAQLPLCDQRGRFLARTDLCFSAQRLAVEYDGGNHRDRLVEDDRRQNALLNAGFRVLRFTAADVLGAPDSVVAAVRAALIGAPAGKRTQAR